MKTYLITGGAGFIGSNFIHYLMKKVGNEIKVLNLDALTYSANRSNVSLYEDNYNYQFIQGNICDEELVQRIFQDHDVDYVVHFAAQTHVDRSITSSKEFAETNVVGTLNLLNAAKDTWGIGKATDKRFLYVSTDEVYGDLPEDGYFTEISPIRPRNPYSASKAAADLMVHAYNQTHGLPVLITRCSNNYGPYQYDEKFIPLCIKCCLTGKEIPVYGDGQNIRDWLYVEDHCKAIDQVLQNGNTGEVYNIGGHNEHTNLEIVHNILRLLKNEFQVPISPIQFVEDRKGHDKRYAIDPAKIKKTLQWQPETAFQDGIRSTIAWYLEHKDFLNLY